VLDSAERPLTDYDLARLCLVAKPRCQIYDAAVGGVFATMLEPDLADWGPPSFQAEWGSLTNGCSREP
jgi:hypothetical protein